MTTSTMKMPASYSAIEAEEMTYLDGGASNAYQSFLDIGKVFNYIARIFSKVICLHSSGEIERIRLPISVIAAYSCFKYSFSTLGKLR